MRTIPIYVILYVIVCLSSCEQKVDFAAEEAAIIAVNEKQLTAFVARDYEGEAEVWVQAPYIVHYHAAAPDIGWQTISSNYKASFDPEAEPVRIYHSMTASNYEIRLNGNIAIVFYDQHEDYTEEGARITNDHRELKYFEKIDGQWKIAVVIPIN